MTNKNTVDNILLINKQNNKKYSISAREKDLLHIPCAKTVESSKETVVEKGETEHDRTGNQRPCHQTKELFSERSHTSGERTSRRSPQTYDAISFHEKEIRRALQKDLGKSGFESYMCETGMVLEEISYMLKHTPKFAREQRVHTPLAQFCSRSYKKPSPYGVTLIMSPWNYPFMLTLSPLADALAAGNTAVVKPSAYSPYTSEVLLSILTECFDPKYVAVVTGGRAENTCLLREHFDYIFFTGSQAVGKEVMRSAAEHLTPVTLELGGKSPCIVDQTADIRLAARRIVFGKYLNCGQTCVAPDYVYCHRSVKDQLIKEVQKQIRRQYGKQPLHSFDYGKIINEKHFDRILGLIDEKKVVHGGGSDRSTLRIEPTVMDNVTFSDAVMQEEIFGPVMPILVFDSLTKSSGVSIPCPIRWHCISSHRTRRLQGK